ncbi:hypothetical protein F0562_021560 [Nyssa sinensis]|uniref:Uncharacterized protein n=1 Tax=Nyssa sinensis TaxID=561372 RepID=A0A5J5BM10_9ASTE|nr:hypothetical protein F0562_021560 [Nyssa sinensis]
MGPTCLARSKVYVEKLFPPGSKLILETMAYVGLMFHLFILGVQVDATMLKKAGRSAALIGTTGFALPHALGGLAFMVVPNLVMVEDTLRRSLPFITALNSMTTFPVITSLLSDLNILNSELGRLAASTCMVSDFWSYFIGMAMTTIGISMRDSQLMSLWSISWFIGFVLIVVLIIRPLILWMANQIPEGQSMKEAHFLAILVIVMVCAFCSEIFGQHIGLGAFVVGVVIPDGPPFGSALVNKLDVLTTGLLLPIKMVIGGLRVNLNTLRTSSVMIIELFIILGYIGKFTGTLVSALYCNVPVCDAFLLSLLMCCKGFIEVAVYYSWSEDGIVDNQAYALMLITMLIVTGVARPLVGHMYDPSRKYMAQSRRTILQSGIHDVELRMLVCIHNEDNVPTIINLLEASKPTRHHPVSVFVLNLMELRGRSAAILEPHFKRGKITPQLSRSDRIVKAFNYFVQHNLGCVQVQHFTAMAPYASMHDDICMLAVDKNVTIVIVPFHKQWTIDGTVGAIFPTIRTVNQNVIKKAPCSVGILVDRGQISDTWSVLTGKALFRVALLFLGGPDDREALAYSTRMADHPSITLTVVWIKLCADNDFSDEIDDETLLDADFMNDFKTRAMGNERVIYVEKTVKDGVGTTRVIHSMEDSFDLFIVGRYHEPESPLISGLTEWSDCPELGEIGDILASSDFQFSVLVVQQQPPDVASLGHSFHSTKV